MYVVGRKGEATSLSVHVPDGWNLATAMDPDGKDSFTAHDYDELIDEPLQMGKFSERDFTVAGIPFKAIFQPLDGDRIRLNLDEQTQVLRKISEPAIKLFGGAPFKRYVYFFHLTGQGFQGGLEHRSGTVIAVPNMDDPDLSDLAAHEFFHAWNVKQMRPSVLGPFDYTQPQRTGNLWFAEGVTDYYSKISTYRSGVHELAARRASRPGRSVSARKGSADEYGRGRLSERLGA
jgi:predicted metalloprotease with PDZ domain